MEREAGSACSRSRLGRRARTFGVRRGRLMIGGRRRPTDASSGRGGGQQCGGAINEFSKDVSGGLTMPAVPNAAPRVKGHGVDLSRRGRRWRDE